LWYHEHDSLTVSRPLQHIRQARLTSIMFFDTLPPKEAYDTHPIHVAVSRDDHEKVASLLERGTDIETLDCVERTPLHLAAHGYYHRVCALLLRRGAALNDTIVDELTEAAVRNFDQDMVDAMLERGLHEELDQRASEYSWSKLEEYLETIPERRVSIARKRHHRRLPSP
jgi:ankyrin repeat protein